MLPRLLLLIAVAWTAAGATAAPVSVLFDRTSLAPGGDTPPGRGDRVLSVQELSPRVGAQTFALPLAWSAVGESVEFDAALSGEMRAAIEGLDAPARIAARLVRRSQEAGELLPELETSALAGLLILEPRSTAGAGRSRSALVRVLTRGNVRDRWTVRPEIAEPDPEAPRVELPAPRLLQVSLVSFGLHLESDDGALPSRLAHVGLRARLWNLRQGRREWDRALLVGSSVPDDGDTGGAFRGRAESLLDDAVDRLAAVLWPELGLEFDRDDRRPPPPPGPAVVEAPAGSELTETVPPEDESVDSLLRRLAETRLTSVPEGDPWQVLAQAVRSSLPPSLEIALACAEDPLGAAVQTGSTRLGLGLADTYRRVEQSPAFRRALASDLLDQVGRSAGDDWQLQRAVRYLLSDLLGQTAPGRDAPSVAGPLLQRARLDGARSPEGLASLLVGLQVWPEGGRAMLRELLES